MDLWLAACESGLWVYLISVFSSLALGRSQLLQILISYPQWGKKKRRYRVKWSLHCFPLAQTLNLYCESTRKEDYHINSRSLLRKKNDPCFWESFWCFKRKPEGQTVTDLRICGEVGKNSRKRKKRDWTWCLSRTLKTKQINWGKEKYTAPK